MDGKNYIADYQILSSSVTFDFGRHIRLADKPKKKIVVSIRKTAAGAGDLTASAYVDGIEMSRGQEV